MRADDMLGCETEGNPAGGQDLEGWAGADNYAVALDEMKRKTVLIGKSARCPGLWGEEPFIA